MTTMKDGPGSDPFADDDQDDVEESGDEPSTEPKREPQMTETSPSTTGKYPYVLRRDTVKENRVNEHVALLRDEFSQLEDDVVRDVADELDMRTKSVSVFDVREAMVQVASENPKRMAEVLLEWGYDAKQ